MRALEIKVNRDRARAVGLTEEEVLGQVEAALEVEVPHGKYERWHHPLDKQSPVLLPAGVDENKVKELSKRILTGTKGKEKVQIGWPVSIRPVIVPSRIDHYDLTPVCAVCLNAEGNEVTKVAAALEQALQDVKPAPGVTLKIRVSNR